MIFEIQTTMKLLCVVSVCLVTWSKITFGEENGLILEDRSEENIPGAAPEPYITAFNDTDGSVLLQCEVLGGPPKPVVEWRNSGGDVLYTRGPQVTKSEHGYKIVLRTFVFKDDRYRCVVTQEQIRHRTESHIDVYTIKGYTTEWIVNVVFDILINVLIVFGCIKACRDYRSRQTEDPEAETTAAEENATILNP